jgi:UDP-N-acetylglucosamine enolpyruvyl transferase
MDKFLIQGGQKLEGEVRISGAKMRHYRYWLLPF